MTPTTPTGRSYLVATRNRTVASYLARIEAAKAGHPNAKRCSVLWIERVDAESYEVVLACRA